ncbi:MAG: hypothetical protein U9P42_03175 [Candidatus Fermentibacteria bacterium]|nr:hypothetical protein [Candidatus Fermentibacteria bacterium]
MESILRKTENEEKEARNILSDSEKKEIGSAAEVKTAEYALSALERELNRLNLSYADLKNAALEPAVNWCYRNPR